MLWGNEFCLTALGKHYNVVWLVASCSDGADEKFDFCRKDEEVEVGSNTRYAMLYIEGKHYQAILHQGRRSFRLTEMPEVVRRAWNFID